jgi:hypothetical protein
MCIKEFVKPVQDTRTLQVERRVQLPVNALLCLPAKIKPDIFPFLTGLTGST